MPGNNRTMARSLAKRLGVDSEEAKDVVEEQRSNAEMLKSLENRINRKGRDKELTKKNRELERQVRRQLLEDMAQKKQEEIVQDEEMLPEDMDVELTKLLESGVPVDPNEIGRRMDFKRNAKEALSDRFRRIRERAIAGERGE